MSEDWDEYDRATEREDALAAEISKAAEELTADTN